MEKPPNYFLVLPLREIALRRVPVILWNDPAILNMIGKLQYNPLYHSSDLMIKPLMRSLECRVADKMSKLCLPKKLKKQMMPVINLVGWEILKWITFHREYLNSSNEDFDSSILQKLCWNIAGSVDYQKTAETLVCCDVLDIVKRFNLACLHFLENYVLEFWRKLPERYKMTFIDATVETLDMQLFLPYTLEKFCELKNLYTPIICKSPYPDNLHFFRISVLFGNKASVEYCFKRLTRDERDKYLVSYAKTALLSLEVNIFRIERKSDIFFYLLTVMTPEQQIAIFKELPCNILICFLAWPWQDLFWEIADVIWTFLPETDYKYLAYKLLQMNYKSGHYVPNFFQKLFLRSPSNFIKSFVNEECSLCLMSGKCFIREDTETIKVIFRNIDAADRLRLVSSKRNLNFIYNQNPHEWHINVEYLQAALLSKKDKEKLKEAFIEHVKSKEGQIEMTDQRWIKLFEFLDETDASAESKRKLEDETFGKVKKICCETKEHST